MPGFQDIEAFVKELYRSRKVLSGLFEKRNVEIDVDMLMPFLDEDEDKLHRLEAYGMIGLEKQSVFLDSRIREFFEQFLEVEADVHVLYIQEYLDKIKEHKSYYLKARQERHQQEHRQKIKHYLRRIISVTVSNVKALRKNTEETYKGEADYQVKKEKLDNLRVQRDKLDGVLKAVEVLLSDDLFFKNAVDDELLSIIRITKNTLRESRNNLIETQQQIIEYLNQAEARTQVIEKVLKLKSLKDKFQLRERTDFEEKAAGLNGLPADRREQIQTRLALHHVFEDEKVLELIDKVRQKQDTPPKNLRKTAPPLQPHALDEEKQTQRTVNHTHMFRKFHARSQDLFTFVMSYEDPSISEITESKRINLYCTMASKYADKLKFTAQTKRWKAWEYAVIYPDDEVMG